MEWLIEEKTADNLKILLIEDDADYRNLAREALRGYERVFAGSAREGIDLFRQEKPDLVFLDLSLPDDYGLEVLVQLRELCPESFVVIVTTSRLAEDISLAQRCAANGYITKPFSRKQLRESCEACATHWNRIRALGEQGKEAFRAKVREQAAEMQKLLHAPNEGARAQLETMLPRWKILVVGNHETGAKHWAKVLASAGCDVTACISATEALGILLNGHYRLVITEDHLMDADASELLFRLRVNHKDLPVMVIVDEEWKQDQSKWRKTGASRVLALPVSDEKLKAMVEKELARALQEMNDIVLKM